MTLPGSFRTVASLMEKIGKVIRNRGERSVVRYRNQCSGDCETCPASHLFRGDPEESLELEAINRVGAKEGDTVRFELGPGPSLAAYGLAYGIPMVGLLGGAILGAILTGRLIRNQTLCVGLFSLLGSVAGFSYTICKGRNFHAVPVITDILDSEHPSPSRGNP